MTWAMLLTIKGTGLRWEQRYRVTLRCDNEPAIEALAREIAQAR